MSFAKKFKSEDGNATQSACNSKMTPATTKGKNSVENLQPSKIGVVKKILDLPKDNNHNLPPNASPEVARSQNKEQDAMVVKSDKWFDREENLLRAKFKKIGIPLLLRFHISVVGFLDPIPPTYLVCAFNSNGRSLHRSD